MDGTSTASYRLPPEDHEALYALARREAIALRRQAMRDAAAWVASAVTRAWRAAARRVVRPEPHACRTLPCPR